MSDVYGRYGARLLRAQSRPRVAPARGPRCSFDPIIRYGGDEFVCGIGRTDLAEAARRFDTIAAAIEANAQVGISVGMAALTGDETPDQLTERADAAMLKVKARHRARI